MMSTYTMSELLLQWQRSEIDTEQAIGHILQHLTLIYQQQSEHGRSLDGLKVTVDELSHRTPVRGDTGKQPPPPRRRRGPS